MADDVSKTEASAEKANGPAPKRRTRRSTTAKAKTSASGKSATTDSKATSAKAGAARTASGKSTAAKATAAGRKKPAARAKAKAKPAEPSAPQTPERAPKPASAKPEQPQTGPTPGAAPEAGAGAPNWFANDAAMKAFSENLFAATLKGQELMAEVAKGVADSEPPMHADPFKVAPQFAEAFAKLATQPDKLLSAQASLWKGYSELWRHAATRATGATAQPVASPERGDKRWRSEAWSEEPVFDVIKQSYLMTSNWLRDLMGSIDGLPPETQQKVDFFTKLFADSFAPTNFAFTNPDVLKAAVETKGGNFVKGLELALEDVKRGQGVLSLRQTDMDGFEVGKDMAATPGQVIYQNRLIQLIQYTPATAEVFERPILVFPPWINKFYILDLTPQKSLIKWLTEQGFTVFLVSWLNPEPKDSDLVFEDYIKLGVFESLDAVKRQTGRADVNAVGYCIGGTMLATTLAYMAQHKDDRIASATFFTAQMDFEESGDLKLFTDDSWMNEIERRMGHYGGVLGGREMADTFNILRSNDLIWSFMINNYMLGKEPQAFDLLYWNADQTRMAKNVHLYYLDNYYRHNRLSKGELEVFGDRVSLSDVDIPVFIQSSKDDHIAPFRSVYRGAKLFGGPVTFMMAGSGHIAGVINPATKPKYQHWLNPELPDTVDAWRADAVEHPGSWWPFWTTWLEGQLGPRVDATTRDPANGVLRPIEPAPGSYVRVRSDIAPTG
ncbi:MAG: class I poly(R)-hydroxyalkanoic acid synthase [Maricaulaceae bacterium]